MARYRLMGALGEGGMGRVWRARDELLGRDVAVKEITPEGLSRSELGDLRARAIREARAIAQINHPNVVRIFDVVEEDGAPWIIMELVASRSLFEVLTDDGPMSPQRAAEVGLDVLAALRAAHKVGILHRDVKPANVLLASDGRVVLTDFGLATLVGDATMTRTGIVIGSPAYLAPERGADEPADAKSDLWSLGAVLFTAVEGRPPYVRSSPMATLVALMVEPPPVSQNAGPLRPVLDALLRKDPAERADADEAERLLRAAAESTVPPAAATPAHYPAGAAPAPNPAGPAPAHYPAEATPAPNPAGPAPAPNPAGPIPVANPTAAAPAPNLTAAAPAPNPAGAIPAPNPAAAAPGRTAPHSTAPHHNAATPASTMPTKHLSTEHLSTQPQPMSLRPMSLRPMSLQPTEPQPTAAPPTAAFPAAAAVRRPRGRRLIWAAAAVALVAGGVVAIQQVFDTDDAADVLTATPSNSVSQPIPVATAARPRGNSPSRGAAPPATGKPASPSTTEKPVAGITIAASELPTKTATSPPKTTAPRRAPTVTMVNNTELTYAGGKWSVFGTRGLGDHQDDISCTIVDGASASYEFTGTGVDYLSEINPDEGRVDVYLDGTFQKTGNLKGGPPREVKQVVFSRSGLPMAKHTIKIVNRGATLGMIDALRIHA